MRPALESLAAFVEREAGHIVLCVFLIAVVAPILLAARVPKADDVLPFALGMLGRSMIGGRGKETKPPEEPAK